MMSSDTGTTATSCSAGSCPCSREETLLPHAYHTLIRLQYQAGGGTCSHCSSLWQSMGVQGMGCECIGGPAGWHGAGLGAAHLPSPHKQHSPAQPSTAQRSPAQRSTSHLQGGLGGEAVRLQSVHHCAVPLVPPAGRLALVFPQRLVAMQAMSMPGIVSDCAALAVTASSRQRPQPCSLCATAGNAQHTAAADPTMLRAQANTPCRQRRNTVLPAAPAVLPRTLGAPPR